MQSYLNAKGSVYRGWFYQVSADYNNDLHISISPSFGIKWPDEESSPDYRTLFSKFVEIKQNNTHSFTIKKRFLGVFISLFPNVQKGVEAAKEFIDKNLGDCNYQKIFKDIIY